MQTIIKKKIKIVHNSTARNNLLHSHYFLMIYSKSLYEYYANTHSMQKDMYICYTYMCSLLYYHSEKLKITPFIGGWLTNHVPSK